MPELPEVETIKRDLETKVVGQTIQNIFIYDPRVLGNQLPAQFIQQLKGKSILSISRRGKALILELSAGHFMVVHLKMTGQLIYGKNLKATQNLKETKIAFELSSGQYLNYNDQRLFGRLMIIKDLKEASFFKRLGPEPLNGVVTDHWLTSQLQKRSAPVKTLLMNQNFLAGIGNIYASEILFHARINPKRPARRLKKAQIHSLREAISKVLDEAISFRGTSLRNYRDSAGEKGKFMDRIKVYGREKKPCLICRTPIKRIVQAGRSTFYCAHCQKGQT